MDGAARLACWLLRTTVFPHHALLDEADALADRSVVDAGGLAEGTSAGAFLGGAMRGRGASLQDAPWLSRVHEQPASRGLAILMPAAGRPSPPLGKWGSAPGSSRRGPRP